MDRKKVLEIFYKISRIPRTSKNEKRIGEWVIKYAQEKGYKPKQDEVGNIVISIPSSKGYEDKDGYVIQGHLDMVGQKTKSSTHNFLKDPIDTEIQGNWLKAKKGTTLGADNGIGVSIGLALLDSDVPHPPLEILLTVDEETGLTGAQKLRSDFLKYRKLLNLDGEENNTITIGCAGSRDLIVSKKYSEVDIPNGYLVLQISVHGGKGGHSGLEIHKKLASSNVLTARLLSLLSNELKVRLVSIKGGTVRNGIAKETDVILAIKQSNKDRFNEIIHAFKTDVVIGEYSRAEKDLVLEVKEVSGRESLNEEDSFEVINTMNIIPHGVISMSEEVEGLVESSNNFALISLDKGLFRADTMTRSAVASKLTVVKNRLFSIASLIKGNFEEANPSPSWKPNIDTDLLLQVKKAHKKVFGKEPVIEACHAGLECGAIGSKYEGMEMVSIGPEILGAHTPEERLNLKSLDSFIKVFLSILRN